MIAKNMAPGLKRSFAFEQWSWIDTDVLTQEKQAAREKQFDGEYRVYASDIRKEVVESAKRSAKFAGFTDDEIDFSCQDYSEVIRKRPT